MKKQILYKNLKNYKYQLYQDYEIQTAICPVETISIPESLNFIELKRDGMLKIKKGYAWDGPSGPSYDSKNFMRGSLVHDALYQLMRNNMIGQQYREYADDLLRRICREDGMSLFRSWYVFRGVRMFAGFASEVDLKEEQKICIAP